MIVRVKWHAGDKQLNTGICLAFSRCIAPALEHAILIASWFRWYGTPVDVNVVRRNIVFKILSLDKNFQILHCFTKKNKKTKLNSFGKVKFLNGPEGFNSWLIHSSNNY